MLYVDVGRTMILNIFNVLNIYVGLIPEDIYLLLLEIRNFVCFWELFYISASTVPL